MNNRYRNRERDDICRKKVENLTAYVRAPDWEKICTGNGEVSFFVKHCLKDLNITQLRKYFDDLKKLETKLKEESNYKDLSRDLYLIIPKVKYAKSRKLCPEYFVKFIEESIKTISEADDTNRQVYFNNFMRILEAIVAYHKYYHPKS